MEAAGSFLEEYDAVFDACVKSSNDTGLFNLNQGYEISMLKYDIFKTIILSRKSDSQMQEKEKKILQCAPCNKFEYYNKLDWSYEMDDYFISFKFTSLKDLVLDQQEVQQKCKDFIDKAKEIIRKNEAMLQTWKNELSNIKFKDVKTHKTLLICADAFYIDNWMDLFKIFKKINIGAGDIGENEFYIMNPDKSFRHRGFVPKELIKDENIFYEYFGTNEHIKGGPFNTIYFQSCPPNNCPMEGVFKIAKFKEIIDNNLANGGILLIDLNKNSELKIDVSPDIFNYLQTLQAVQPPLDVKDYEYTYMWVLNKTGGGEAKELNWFVIILIALIIISVFFLIYFTISMYFEEVFKNEYL
jgi:hypothetical protein